MPEVRRVTKRRARDKTYAKGAAISFYLWGRALPVESSVSARWLAPTRTALCNIDKNDMHHI